MISIPLEIYLKVSDFFLHLRLPFQGFFFFFVWFKIKVQFHYFSHGYWVFPMTFIEETILSPLGILVASVENHLTVICAGLSLSSLFCSIVCPYLYIHCMPLSFYYYYSFEIYFEIRSFVLVQVCFGYLGSFVDACDFRNFFLSVNNFIETLLGIALHL